MKNKEYILCAAFKFKDGYRTPRMEEIAKQNGIIVEDKIYYSPHNQVFKMALGWRHADIIYKYGDVIDQSDTGGFMTSTARYVDRYEAAKIAFEAGQIDKEKHKLFSEDLY